MKVIEIEQNTEIWFEFKLGKSGGSRAEKLIPKINPTNPDIEKYALEHGYEITEPAPTKADPEKVKSMTIENIMAQFTAEEKGELKALAGNKKDEFYKMLAEIVARPITPNDYEDRLNGQKFTMMDRGHILEPEALLAFEAQTGKKTIKRSVVWQRDDNKQSIVSPDSEVQGENSAIEVKCLDTHRILRAWHENTYPEEYQPQVVKYFATNEKLENVYVVLYTDVLPALPIQIFKVKREDVADKIDEFIGFENEIIKQVNELAERLVF